MCREPHHPQREVVGCFFIILSQQECTGGDSENQGQPRSAHHPKGLAGERKTKGWEWGTRGRSLKTHETYKKLKFQL